MSDDASSFVLTGCAGGIGRHLADVLVARGQQVFATDVDLDTLAEHAEAQAWPAERTRVRRLDVRDPQAWAEVLDEAVSTFGCLDVLMNIAGVLQPGPAHRMQPEHVHQQIDVNTKGVIFGTQAAARHMVEQKRGHIINIGSFSALIPVPGIAVYSASKYAVRAFSLAAAHELRPFGVHVTVVHPELVQTPMIDPEQDWEEAAMVFSPPGLLTVDEVAGVIFKRVLGRKPLEVFVPRRHGWLARGLDLFPRIGLLVMPVLQRRGLARLRKLRGRN